MHQTRPGTRYLSAPTVDSINTRPLHIDNLNMMRRSGHLNMLCIAKSFLDADQVHCKQAQSVDWLGLQGADIVTFQLNGSTLT